MSSPGDDATGLSKPFGQEAIASAVHATLDAAFAAIPDGRSHAVLFDGTYTKDGGSVRALYAQRLDKGWNIVLEGDVDKPHGVGGSVVVAKSW